MIFDHLHCERNTAGVLSDRMLWKRKKVNNQQNMALAVCHTHHNARVLPARRYTTYVIWFQVIYRDANLHHHFIKQLTIMGKSADGRHVSHLSECESCQVDSQEYWPLKLSGVYLTINASIRCIIRCVLHTGTTNTTHTPKRTKPEYKILQVLNLEKRVSVSMEGVLMTKMQIR